MRSLKLFSLVLLCVSIISCEKYTQELESSEADYSSTFQKTDPTCPVDLVAGQIYVVGTVEVSYNSPSEITVNYLITDPDWCFEETHLDIQVNPDNFPQTIKGNPKVGHFAYGSGLSCEASWSQTIDLNTIASWEEGDMIYITAHAEVVNLSGQGESAWSEGTSFPGNNWAMYFSCEPPPFWTCGDPIVDVRDGQEYNTVQIGDQCWMAENINIGTRINGDTYQDPGNGYIEKFCMQNIENLCEVYGGLYQWDELMQGSTLEGTQGICPLGWHVGSDQEWDILINYLGGIDIAGGPMKEAGTDHWTSPNTGADNTSGFTALPGGIVNPKGAWDDYLLYGQFYSSTEADNSTAYHRRLNYNNRLIQKYNHNKLYGRSVRCTKD